MGYKKATHVLPHDLLLKVQEYIDGEFLYIPRISDHKKEKLGRNNINPSGVTR